MMIGCCCFRSSYDSLDALSRNPFKFRRISSCRLKLTKVVFNRHMQWIPSQKYKGSYKPNLPSRYERFGLCPIVLSFFFPWRSYDLPVSGVRTGTMGSKSYLTSTNHLPWALGRSAWTKANMLVPLVSQKIDPICSICICSSGLVTGAEHWVPIGTSLTLYILSGVVHSAKILIVLSRSPAKKFDWTKVALTICRVPIV